MTVLPEVGERDLAGEFPSLQREGLHYLDAAATSQTPQSVIAAMDDYYEHHRASVHRGVYPLADLGEHGHATASASSSRIGP